MAVAFEVMEALLVLHQLVHQLGAQAEPVSSMFDLVAGTSGGGLAALLLGRLGFTAKEAAATFKDLGAEVFGDRDNYFQIVRKVVDLTQSLWRMLFEVDLVIKTCLMTPLNLPGILG